jgi:hypothetical protein
MNLWRSGSISVVGSLLDARILMKIKGYPRSNLAPWSKLRRLGLFFLHWRRWNRGDGAPPWPRLGELKLTLWCTICDEVSSYVIYETRGIQFTHMWWRKRVTDGRRRQCRLDDLQRRWGLQGALRRWQSRRGLLLQAINRRGRPWQGGSMAVDG